VSYPRLFPFNHLEILGVEKILPLPVNYKTDLLPFCSTTTTRIDTNGQPVSFRYEDGEGFDVTIDVDRWT
jgi:hypothetical protein